MAQNNGNRPNNEESSTNNAEGATNGGTKSTDTSENGEVKPRKKRWTKQQKAQRKLELAAIAYANRYNTWTNDPIPVPTIQRPQPNPPSQTTDANLNKYQKAYLSNPNVRASVVQAAVPRYQQSISASNSPPNDHFSPFPSSQSSSAALPQPQHSLHHSQSASYPISSRGPSSVGSSPSSQFTNRENRPPLPYPNPNRDVIPNALRTPHYQTSNHSYLLDNNNNNNKSFSPVSHRDPNPMHYPNPNPVGMDWRRDMDGYNHSHQLARPQHQHQQSAPDLSSALFRTSLSQGHTLQQSPPSVPLSEWHGLGLGLGLGCTPVVGRSVASSFSSCSSTPLGQSPSQSSFPPSPSQPSLALHPPPPPPQTLRQYDCYDDYDLDQGDDPDLDLDIDLDLVQCDFAFLGGAASGTGAASLSAPVPAAVPNPSLLEEEDEDEDEGRADRISLSHSEWKHLSPSSSAVCPSAPKPWTLSSLESLASSEAKRAAPDDSLLLWTSPTADLTQPFHQFSLFESRP